MQSRALVFILFVILPMVAAGESPKGVLPKGGLTLTGRITDKATGAPIANATVKAVIRCEDPLPFNGRERIVTGPDGHVIVDGISRPSPPIISASKDGYSGPDPVRPEFNANDARGKITLMLRPAEPERPGVLVGQVTDEHGKGLAGACLAWASISRYANRGGDQACTDAEGRYRLSPDFSPGGLKTAVLCGISLLRSRVDPTHRRTAVWEHSVSGGGLNFKP